MPNEKETIWEKLERSNPDIDVRLAIRRAQLASDQSEGLKGTLGKYRMAEHPLQTLLNNIQDIDPEISAAVDEFFWDLV